MGTARALSILTVLFVLAAAPVRADAPPAASIAPLDARHVVVLRGDRMVIYEIDPARNHQARVVNTVLLDDEGQIAGQFRPDPEAGPTVVPKLPGDSPKPEPQATPRRPAPRQPAPSMLHARHGKRISPATAPTARSRTVRRYTLARER
jgi:hypothetical protein